MSRAKHTRRASVSSLDSGVSASSLDLYRRFPEIPSTELLVSDYLCALLQKGLLLQGRLYITDTRLAFYSNIIGHVKRVTIRHEDIDSIKKVNVAIIPTGLDITSEGIEMHLRSFIHRDMAYSDLLHFWSQTDVYQSPDRSSEYEGTLAVHSAPESPGISDSNQTASPASSDGSTLIGDFFPRMRKSLSAYVDSPSSPDRSDAGVDLAKETTFDSSTTHSLALPEGNDEWVTLFDHEYPTKIAYLWDILQGGENVAEGVLPSHPDGFTGAFLSQLSGAKDYQASPWTLPSSSQKMDHLKFDDIQRDAHRSLSYTVLHSKMAVETRILHHNKRSVVYLHESSCSGVPYSDAFQAVTRIHLTQGNVSTRHRVEFRVQFQKHVPWVAQKSLEQGLLYRFREYYEKLDVTLKKVLGVTTSRPYHMERRGSSPLFNTLGNPSYTAALTNRSLRRKSHLNKTMENSPILVVMTWVFLAYGIYATLQLQSQLDSLMSKLEGN